MAYRLPTLEQALKCAVDTAIQQPAEVPERTLEWINRANLALTSGNKDEISVCAVEIRKAHSQYRAEFDIKGWLYDLRNINHVEQRLVSLQDL